MRDDFFDIAYIAMTKAMPDLTREAFDALEPTLTEVIQALPVIAKQAGLMGKKKPDAEVEKSATGEASSAGILS